MQIKTKRDVAFAIIMGMCLRHSHLDEQDYEPIGFVSVHQREQIEALDEAQLQKYKDTCSKEAEERKDERDDGNSAEELSLQMHGGNRITNCTSVHGLGKIEHNSPQKVIGKLIDYAHQEGEPDNRRRFK